MSFSDEEEKRGSATRRTTYLKVIPGVPVVIRMLDTSPELIYKHWLKDTMGKWVGIRCLGLDHCPICQRNAQLGFNREHPQYIASRKRYRMNVVDLTPVKRCPTCGATYYEHTAPARCTSDSCGADLSGIVSGPLNEVKILERGPALKQQFGVLEKTPHPLLGEVVPLQSYPIMLVASGKGRDMVIAVLPQMPVEPWDDNYERYDLKSGLVLTPEEITYLLEGGNFSDILEERKAARQISAGNPSEGGDAKSGVDKEEIPF